MELKLKGECHNGNVSVLDGNWIQNADGTIQHSSWVGTDKKINLGDTINYNPKAGLNTSNSSDMIITSKKDKQSDGTGGNGYDDQILNLNNYSGTWKALGVEDGKLKCISSDVVKTGMNGDSFFYLYGKDGYQNGPSELNRMCSIFGKGTYAESARNVNVDEINKVTGYTPLAVGINTKTATNSQIASGERFEQGTIEEYGHSVSYYWEENEDKPKYTFGTSSGNLTFSHNNNEGDGGFNWFDGAQWNHSAYTGNAGLICSITCNYYWYHVETLTVQPVPTARVGLARDTSDYELFFKPSGGEEYSYWLANNCIRLDTRRACMSVRRVGGSVVSHCGLYISDGRSYGDTEPYGLRPIVILKNGIQLEKDANDVWQIQ